MAGRPALVACQIVALSWCGTLVVSGEKASKAAKPVTVDPKGKSLLDEYPKGLLGVPKGGQEEVDDFVSEHMEPRHAVAVAVFGKGTKRHMMIKEIAEDDALNPVMAIGAQFDKGRDSLTLYLDGYDSIEYTGKWQRKAITEWLLQNGYPLVNQMQYGQFPLTKYFKASRFGVVIIVKSPKEQTSKLIKFLEPYAEQYKDKLKFTFMAKVEDPKVKRICELFGIWTPDEMHLILDPTQAKVTLHSNIPSEKPKYRLEKVTMQSVQRFFTALEKNALPRYYRPSVYPAPPKHVDEDGIRHLTSWDFDKTIQDPHHSVLVRFTSQKCEQCETTKESYRALARTIQAEQLKNMTMLSSLIVAEIDQTMNEHSIMIAGTPMICYWPRGAPMVGFKGYQVVDQKGTDSILKFLKDEANKEKDISDDDDRGTWSDDEAEKEAPDDEAEEGEESDTTPSAGDEEVCFAGYGKLCVAEDPNVTDAKMQELKAKKLEWKAKKEKAVEDEEFEEAHKHKEEEDKIFAEWNALRRAKTKAKKQLEQLERNKLREEVEDHVNEVQKEAEEAIADEVRKAKEAKEAAKKKQEEAKKKAEAKDAKKASAAAKKTKAMERAMEAISAVD
eukprot:gnl/TRDRNA2_/TRDRNA2_166529_c0_seq1.p1 gnl/TRDRNA2_/TRDRNA2_166529_c0~~gnl/TRDRNA2_/TRDRNA2_166529_c0_seq1.p1  ORF type:complete len:631 (-),score=182.43 gnl/TRDRNA2_/TRDRNA2_166529_c0_seq1:79-1920(-)